LNSYAGTNSLLNTYLGTRVTSELGTKADITLLNNYVGTNTTLITNLSTRTTNELGTKADKTDLDLYSGTNSLQTTYLGTRVTNELGTKADITLLNSYAGTNSLLNTYLGTRVTSELGTKADITTLNSYIGTATKHVIGASFISPTTGTKTFGELDYNFTIQSASLQGDPSGSITVEIKKGPASGFPVGTSITGGTGLVLTSGVRVSDSLLTGWSPLITSTEFILFNIVSVSTITKASINLKGVKS
jgi:hypothetical protein